MIKHYEQYLHYEIIHKSFLKELTRLLIISKRGKTFLAIAVSAILPTRTADSENSMQKIAIITLSQLTQQGSSPFKNDTHVSCDNTVIPRRMYLVEL